jgi:TolB-like protein/predicted Ser/Thr protein kinase
VSEPERALPSLPITVVSVGRDEEPASAQADSAAPLPSRQELGRYRILGLLGSGGMGNVYRALDTELDEVVALKMLRHDLADQQEVVERFRREVKLARRITHRNIARVFDIGEAEGEKFLTMELIEGPSLAEVLAERRALPLAEALELAATICDGLGAAHAAGVVHLDLKPGNVLLERGGRVVLTDFGIARALAEAHAADGPHGTPGYMAPEQVLGSGDVDARADIHAMGALLYEMVTGRQPWAGQSPYAIASARLREPPPDPRLVRPELPAALGEIIARAMAQLPGDRYGSAAEIALALSQLAPPPPSRATGEARDTREIPAESSLRRVRAHDKAVAVLPFRNAGAAADDYLAEELTDDLIDALSMTAGIRVSARGVVAGYRGAAVDPREVGRALGVQVVADGSVRRGGGRVRVSARLVSVHEGFQLWARRFDRPEEDVLAVNDEVARSIAAALTVDFLRPTRSGPHDAASVDLYMRARNRYRRFWPEQVAEAIALFEEAAAVAPGDPAVLGGLALARTRLSYFSREAIPAAVEAGRRAIAAAAAGAASGEPHVALGSALLNAGNAVEAVHALRRAVELSPGLPEAQAALGRVLVEAGDLEEGPRRLRAALALDPEAPLALGALLRVHAFAGEWDRAQELCERLRATDGDLGYLLNRARLCAWRRDPTAAASLVGAAAPLGQHGLLPDAMIALVARGGGPAEVPDLTALQQYAGASLRAQAFIWQAQVELCAFAGDGARALDALEQASACELVDRLWLDRCPLFDALRGEPRFAAVAASVARRCAAILAAYASR